MSLPRPCVSLDMDTMEDIVLMAMDSDIDLDTDIIIIILERDQRMQIQKQKQIQPLKQKQPQQQRLTLMHKQSSDFSLEPLAMEVIEAMVAFSATADTEDMVDTVMEATFWENVLLMLKLGSLGDMVIHMGAMEDTGGTATDMDMDMDTILAKDLLNQFLRLLPVPLLML